MNTDTSTYSSMRNIILCFTGVSCFVVSLYLTANAHWIRSYSSSKIITNGFGRELEPVPFLLRMLFTTDSLWAGFGWSVAYTTGILISFAIGALCFTQTGKNH